MDNTLKKQICDSLKNPQDKYKQYNIKDVKTGKPKKGCGCYVIKIINGYPEIWYGKFENDKFYKACFTSCGHLYDSNTYVRQHVYYEEINPDAYVLYKNNKK